MTEAPDAWDTIRHWWHAGFAVAIVTAVPLTLAGPGSATRRWSGVACLAALALMYAAVGRRLLDERDPSVVRRSLYLAPTIAIVLVGLLLTPGFFAVLFIVIPQIYASGPTFRAAVGPAVAVHGAMLIGTARWFDPAFSTRAWAQATLQTAIIMVFSLGMGGFIMRIIEQSRERAELIAELQRTRHELALVSRDAGTLAERERLAHEIHDTLAQGFTSIVLLAQTAGALLGDGTHAAQRHVRAIEETARENLAEARALVAELAPPSLAAGSLPAAVGRLVDRLAAEVGLDARLHVDGEPRSLGANEEVALLRAVQEALTNVRRHAQARTVEVTLRYGATDVGVQVRDDGCGFDEHAAAAGYGLAGMRARLEQLGGWARVHSAPGAGTTVDASIETVPA